MPEVLLYMLYSISLFHVSSRNSLVCQWPPLFISFSPPLCPTGPPSAPRNVISSINETSVILDWSWPEDSGGRRDITFTVLCKRCRGVTGNGSSGGTQSCEPCRSNVRFLPRSAGLQNTTVTVADLLAHTNYTFEIEAQNGVSPLAPKMRQYAAVTITTNQAGETSQGGGSMDKGNHSDNQAEIDFEHIVKVPVFIPNKHYIIIIIIIIIHDAATYLPGPQVLV